MSKDSKLSEFVAHPNRSLWKLAIPMTLGLFVNSIYILVDTYFIGNIPNIGTSAISALGYVMPFYFIVMGTKSRNIYFHLQFTFRFLAYIRII